MITSLWPLLPHQQSYRQVDLPYTSFQDLLKAKTERGPAREFLIFPESERRYTYREFYDLAAMAADWVRARAQPRATICILFRNTPEFLAVFFGAVAHGMTVVPINPDLAAQEIYFIVENSGGGTVFYDPGLKEKLSPLEAQMRQVGFFPLSD